MELSFHILLFYVDCCLFRHPRWLRSSVVFVYLLDLFMSMSFHFRSISINNFGCSRQSHHTDIWPFYFQPVCGPKGSTADGVPDSYGARIINFGIEFEYPIFKNLGMTRIAYGCAAYEEGKIVYKTEDLAAAGKDKPYYDPDRPWEFEHTITISQEINDLVSCDITWHYGRFILNSYFATKSQYVTIGARLDFDGKVTLYDSDRQ